ncbi:GntR family transcriptional regulator [Variovorax robiniae]|uniref:GntR family transcriptional regulator n=1 Tax=Variovorax robiniae TaxID=1836199 RepID=A0ABU8XIF4_9BURK
MDDYISFVNNKGMGMPTKKSELGAERADRLPGRAKKAASRQLQTLPEQIAEHIFTAIASGEYAPGDRIREESLAEEFEVSRGPVREALRLLESDSVVRILPNRGAHVTQLSIKEVGDVFEIRRTLSGAMIARLSAEEAVTLATTLEADIKALDALAQDPASDAAAYFDVSFRLARTLRDSCGNERLAEILSSLARQTLRYTQLGLATPARRKESARNWRAMQKALKAGNVEVAAESVEKLIEDSKREAVRQLQAREAGQGA